MIKLVIDLSSDFIEFRPRRYSYKNVLNNITVVIQFSENLI